MNLSRERFSPAISLKVLGRNKAAQQGKLSQKNYVIKRQMKEVTTSRRTQGGEWQIRVMIRARGRSQSQI